MSDRSPNAPAQRHPIPPALQRRAPWIWRDRRRVPDGFLGMFMNLRDHADEKDRFLFFRRTVDLATRPTAATLNISADGRYRLWVNGVPVGRGPTGLRIDRGTPNPPTSRSPASRRQRHPRGPLPAGCPGLRR